MRSRCSFFLTTILVGTGCVTSRSYQPATTIDSGEWQLQFELSGAASDLDLSRCSHLAGCILSFTPAASYGISDRVELTGSVGQEGVGLQGKWAVLQDRARGGLTLSVAPYVGAFLWLSYGAELPVVLGWRVSNDSEFVVAATTKYRFLFNIAATDTREWSSGIAISFHHWAGDRHRISVGVGGHLLHETAGAMSGARFEASVAVTFPVGGK